jgi:hypothetical protein
MIIVSGVTKDDFESWWANKVTEQVFNAIYKELVKTREDMGKGNFLNAENPYKTQARMFEMSGKCSALESVVNLQVE